MARQRKRRTPVPAAAQRAPRKGVREGGHPRDPAVGVAGQAPPNRALQPNPTATSLPEPQAAAVAAPIDESQTRPLQRVDVPPAVVPPADVRAGVGQASPVPAPTRHGTWLPALSVVSGGALVAIAVADSGARLGAGWAEALFWLGLGVLILPVATRLSWPGVSRNERLGLVLVLVVGAYLVKVLHGPVDFVFADEFAHERTVVNILTHGRILDPNSLSVASPLYPGLELVTAALVSLTGMSIHAAALLVVGVGRAVLAVALFLLVERLAMRAGIAGSGQLAGIAAAIYAGNPNFTFWSAQFAYESLSLPLAMLVIYLCVAAASLGRRRLYAVAFLVGLAIVATHHLTTYALVGLLVGWVAVAWLRRRRAVAAGRTFVADELDAPPVWLVVGIAAATLAWLLTVARATIGYLAPVVAGALQDLAGFIGGSRSVKAFFRGDPALVSPPWERVVAFGSVVLVAGLLVLGLLRLVAARRAGRPSPLPTLSVVFGLAALAYFPLLALRALQHGTEISNRAGDFLFLPIGAIVAPVLAWLSRLRWRAIGRALLGATLAIVFIGGVIIGMPRWARLPGPYLVSGDTRALQPETFLASDWLRGTFGTGNPVIADQTNALVLGSSGRQDLVHGLSWVYFSGGTLDRFRMSSLHQAGIRFIVVDWRLTTMTPLAGYYFESGEPSAGNYSTPLPAIDLLAFDRAPQLSRVFDSGDIEIFEVRS